MSRRSEAKGKCHKSGGKRMYPDEQTAKRALEWIRHQPVPAKNGRTPHRYYECPHCRQWHLSSRAAPPPAIGPLSVQDITPEPRTPVPGPTELELVTAERDALDRIVRRCITDGCGTCMHSVEWGRLQIERGMDTRRRSS